MRARRKQKGAVNVPQVRKFSLQHTGRDAERTRGRRVERHDVSERHAREKSGAAYIHGSVEESPSGERSRSLDRPGANTPRPWPRTEMHQGSLCVNLHHAAWCQRVQDGRRRGAWPEAGHAPVFHAVSEPVKAELSRRRAIRVIRPWKQ